MFKIISHTADIGIEVEAVDWEQLFKEAARGWKALVFEDSSIQGKENKPVNLEAQTVEELLVDWLNELNYFLTVHFWVFDKVLNLRISQTGEMGWKLQAEVSGEPYNQDRHYIYFDIKAVTFHQLQIRYDNGKLKTRIFFDI